MYLMKSYFQKYYLWKLCLEVNFVLENHHFFCNFMSINLNFLIGLCYENLENLYFVLIRAFNRIFQMLISKIFDVTLKNIHHKMVHKNCILFFLNSILFNHKNSISF